MYCIHVISNVSSLYNRPDGPEGEYRYSSTLSLTSVLDGVYSDWLWLDGPGIESRWGKIFRPSRPAHPASCTMGTGSFPGVKYGRGVLLTTHRLLVLRSWKSRAIPLPTLWDTTDPVTGTLYLLPLLDGGGWSTPCPTYPPSTPPLKKTCFL